LVSRQSRLSRQRALSSEDIMGQVNRVVETLNDDRQFLDQVAQFKGLTVVLSATDTGRELSIMFDRQGVCAHFNGNGSFDVKIQATEETHLAMLSGKMDPDAAFFTGKARIRGSVLTAFRVKNKFLSLVQWHLVHEFPDQGQLPS
jgi:putative sterol carrier protein